MHHAGFSKETLLRESKQKDPGFDHYWLGVAFERIKSFDQTSPEMGMLLKPITFQEMLAFFDAWRLEIARELGK